MCSIVSAQAHLALSDPKLAPSTLFVFFLTFPCPKIKSIYGPSSSHTPVLTKAAGEPNVYYFTTENSPHEMHFAFD